MVSNVGSSAEEAKNTIEHNISAQERAHSVHTICWVDTIARRNLLGWVMR